MTTTNARIGSYFSIHNASGFRKTFLDQAVYLYVGAPTAWADDNYPPAPDDSNSGHRDVWNNMVGMIRVNYGDTREGIDRNDWTTGKVYNKYDHTKANEELASGNGFFILAGELDRNIYKCLDNNNNAPSTMKPRHTNLTPTKETDGYVWEYVYTITDSEFRRFATDTVVPVRDSYASIIRSTDGAIVNVPIAESISDGTGRYYRGSGYSTGTVDQGIVNGTIYSAVSATATNELTLDATSGFGGEDYYNNSAIYMTSSSFKGFGSIRTITDWSASTNTVVITPGVTNIDSGTRFIIGPKVTISNGDGSGFLGIGEVNGYGNLVNIIVGSTGAGYVNSAFSVDVNGIYPSGTLGTAAIANAYITPLGGHGNRLGPELNGKYIIVSTDTTIADNSDSEAGVFVGPTNVYRQAGLVRNPRIGGLITTQTPIDMRTNIYFQSPVPGMDIPGQISKNDTITNANTGGTARVWSVVGPPGNQYLSVINMVGAFSEGDMIYSGNHIIQISNANLHSYEYPSRSQQTPTEAIQRSSLAKYTGDIIYQENFSQIARYHGQKENFKFVFEF